MFLLTIIPFVWGYLLTTRLLHESQRWLRWSLAYALGLLSFLAGVNALFHFLSLRSAVIVTLTLQAIGTVVLLRYPRPRRPPTVLGTVEGPILALLAFTAFFEALFWQMQWSDDDFYVHAPFVALFLRDVFPLQNPYFPTIPWVGHYGRDLAISALSVLWGERLLAVQYFVTAANQAAAVLVLHGTTRRFLRSPTQALWVVLFAFAGVNLAGSRGLLETFKNNNSFAFLFLFVNIHLFLTALARRSPSLIVLTGLALGTYALIYETSYGLLVLTFMAFPLVLCALRQRWRLQYFSATAAILILSGALALIQGGVLTEMPKRILQRQHVANSSTREDQLMRREIRVRIPKPGFTITSAFSGDEYPLWSRRLAADAGMFIPFLPLTVSLMLWRRKPWGILVCALSTVAILLPAAVDFGTYNADSLRFLLVGGVGAAMLIGASLGLLWEAVRTSGPWPRMLTAAAVGCVAAMSLWPSTKFALGVVRAAARYPHHHYLVAEEWGCARALPQQPCEPIDVLAAIALRPLIPATDRILLDFRGDSLAPVMSSQAAFLTFARVLLAGPALKPLQDERRPLMSEFWDDAGSRARVFFGTGEVSLLDDLGVRFIYFNPANLSPEVYRRIQQSPRLERILRLDVPEGGPAREAYRVRPGPSPFASTASPTVILVSADPPDRLQARRVYPVRLVFAGLGNGLGAPLCVSYELRLLDGRLVTQNDDVRLPVDIVPAGDGRWAGTLWLASPYKPGEYSVTLYTCTADTRLALRYADGRQAVFQVRID